ncbi:MAG TPA: DUF4861 family protein, partial [Mariniphaga sp.]|nr:DUF4861 family protein [Mariniphaga sp.]
MNLQTTLIILLTGLLFSCGNNDPVLSFKNPQEVERPDEVIVLAKNELTQKIGSVDGKFPLFKSGNEQVPFQLDDLDQDGNWDEVALLLNFAPGQTHEVSVEWVDGSNYPPQFEKRTNLRLGITQEDGSFVEVDSYRAL